VSSMQIKKLAAATGVDVETIRYYEKQGLLPAPARLDNGYRQYETAHLERLSFIRHCRALDMPLAEVQRLLSFVDDPARHCADVNELVDAQLGRVRARLASMQALEKQLVQLRARCGPPQASPAGGAGAVSEAGAADQADGAACGILAELVSAAHGEACACHPGEALA
jgi:Cd(II)/Pb(II)-responsive transcriptional regulator